MIFNFLYKILYLPFEIFGAFLTAISILFQSTIENRNNINRDERVDYPDESLECAMIKVLRTFREHMHLADESANIPVLEPYRKKAVSFGTNKKLFRLDGQLKSLEIRGLSSFKVCYLDIQSEEHNEDALMFMTEVLIQKLNIASLFNFKCDFLSLFPYHWSGYFVADLIDIIIILKGNMHMPQAGIHSIDIHASIEDIKLDIRGFSAITRKILQTFANSFGVPFFNVVWPSFKYDIAEWLEENIIMNSDEH